MMDKAKLEDALKPFYAIAQLLRQGDASMIESHLHVCSAFISKYALLFDDTETLTLLVSQINQAYRRKDYVCLADIFEYELTSFLRLELAKAVEG